VSDEMDHFTPSTLNTLAGKVEDVRTETMFGVEGAGADPEAEQCFLLALNHLETASRYFKLAALKQTRALAGR
jgi:hypothetical protein